MALLFCVCTLTPDNCSDGNLVDYKTEFCYDGKAVPKCAGNKYDPPTQDCVSDKVEEKCINGKYAKSGEPCEPKASTFTVRFETDGGTPETISSVTVDTGKTMGTKFPEDPKKTSLIFDGWFDDDKKYDSSTVITKNVTLKAKFKLKHFTVRFDTDGGTPETISSVTVDTGKTMGEKLPSNPAKMGFTFDGWFHNDNRYDSSTVITEDVTLKAKYQVKRFTVQFNTDGGSPSSISPVTVDTGKTLGDNLPSSPTKTGFSFDGWYYADGASYYTSLTPITMNVTLRAQWAAAGTSTTKYTLTISSNPENGGTVNPATGQEYTAGTEVTVTATPNTGYIFTDWSGASESTDNEVTIKMDDNKSLTAKFELKKYTVTFDTDGGSTIEPITVEHGKTVGTEKFPSNPTKTSHTFVGWYDGDVQYNSSTVITKNVTLKAVFEAIPITYHSLNIIIDPLIGGDVLLYPKAADGGGYAHGTSVKVTAEEAVGYTFVRWSGASTSTNPEVTVTMNTDITLTANFVVSTYTVNANVIGDGAKVTTPLNFTVTHGQDSVVRFSLTNKNAAFDSIVINGKRVENPDLGVSESALWNAPRVFSLDKISSDMNIEIYARIPLIVSFRDDSGNLIVLKEGPASVNTFTYSNKSCSYDAILYFATNKKLFKKTEWKFIYPDEDTLTSSMSNSQRLMLCESSSDLYDEMYLMYLPVNEIDLDRENPYMTHRSIYTLQTVMFKFADEEEQTIEGIANFSWDEVSDYFGGRGPCFYAGDPINNVIHDLWEKTLSEFHPVD